MGLGYVAGFSRTNRNVGKLTFNRILTVFCVAITMALVGFPEAVKAQSYRFNTVQIQGNQRVESATIITFAGIQRGKTVSAAALNDGYQRILGSGLFETVELVPRGGTLVIRVTEFPTINIISFEGNKRIKDEPLSGFINSESRRVFDPTTAENDAAIIAAAYSEQGRVAAVVTPVLSSRSL